MSWKQVVFALIIFFLAACCPSYGQAMKIDFVGWTTEAAAVWQSHYDQLRYSTSGLYPPYVGDEERFFVKGPETGWSFTIGNQIIVGVSLNSVDPRDSLNGPAFHVARHEYDHLLQMVKGKNGKWHLLVPPIWAEGLAEIFALKAYEMMRPYPFHHHSRQLVHRRESPWAFWTALTPDLALRYASEGANPFMAAWSSMASPAYSLRAYPLLEIEREVGPTFFPELHKILKDLSEQILKKGEPYRMIRQQDILDRLDKIFPGTLMHDLPLKLFIQTQPAFGKPREGPNFSVEAWSAWFEGNNYLGGGPVNPQVISFSAVTNSMFFQADDPANYWGLEQRRLGTGRYSIEVLDSSGASVCVMDGCKKMVVDLSLTPGGNTWVIDNPPNNPGRYSVVAKDDKVVASNKFEVTTENPLSINPVQKGWMDWEKWPVLELSPEKIVLSPTRPNANVRIRNINPNATGALSWDSRPEVVGTAVWNSIEQYTSSWLDVSPAFGQGPAVLSVKPGVTTRQEGQVCFQGNPGFSVSCVEVIYTPR